MGLPESSVGLMVAIGAGAGIAAYSKAPRGRYIVFSRSAWHGYEHDGCACSDMFVSGGIADGQYSFRLQSSRRFQRDDSFGSRRSCSSNSSRAFLRILFHNICRSDAQHTPPTRIDFKRWLRNIIAERFCRRRIHFSESFRRGLRGYRKSDQRRHVGNGGGKPLTELRLDSGWFVLAVTAGVALVKGIAMSATTSGGGVAAISHLLFSPVARQA